MGNFHEERERIEGSTVGAPETGEPGLELAACFREPGSPHPDPVLAAKGWHVSECGVYTRARAAELELEAG